MSTAHDAHSTQAHDAHSFDGEPVKHLPPDEPQTPGWVPALGLALFVLVGIWLLASSAGDGSSTKPASPDAPSAPEDRAAQVRPAIAPPGIVPGQRPAPAAPGQSVAPPVARLTPEQAKALQQRIEQARAKQQAAGVLPPQPGQPAQPAQPQPAPQPGGGQQ